MNRKVLWTLAGFALVGAATLAIMATAKNLADPDTGDPYQSEDNWGKM